MINRIIESSLQNKLIVLLATAAMAGFGFFSLTHIPIGAVPDVTNNQVQVITTSRNLSTLDVERFITYPVELEMANLPGLKEIRSISKFGLSVVTIVFEDNIGTYLPRQLIAERLKTAAENIPQGFGTPFMGPISTGLGEIYQYILEVAPAYDSVYSISDLRTIQDWVVRRQLSGIPGVVEVNTWGGYLKQYEVAVNPELLHAMDISIEEVYGVLQTNNSVVGGGYIEKTNQTYFIRGEGLASSVSDLEQIVVRERNGVIVRVKDIAKVQFGHATRFGAITANGEGEKVLGQVMMLKGANSNEVINSVKQRVEEISETLPPGISINGFLERSSLIKKTTTTIAENLILGCLIVIFVVVLLLGNMRSGLVVASVIPLSLLFALSLMYLFGVDANLMSLGAIDFGIIIDGAVIIVEFIAYQISRNRDELFKLEGVARQEMIDKITLKGTKKLMRSAMFGQLIIIIVFIPILSLTGIEGKMFTPMAQVFTFALIGTMLLGFTYVPVVSSMFLKPPKNTRNISTRLIDLLNKAYEPSISWALNHKKTVMALTLGVLLGAIGIFSTMGGEFVPTLDEGDFVIQPVLKTGTTLSNTIELTTRMEQILKTFPEVKQIVSRIGAAEVPTDPMSMEESDIIITLKPAGEWTTAKTKDGLADKFKEALSVIPGVDFEFTQPIEMRFNELITGTRADLAIKIFGEDLDVLNNLAQKIKTLAEPVEGASDVVVEKVAGLPEMTISYDRTKLALYGLNVDDVNKVISMAFAGLKAGEIFEGEKRFDLVIRYQDDFRNNIENLRNTFIPMRNGHQVPLKEVADVHFSKGPAKISRDNTHRRIVVGVNVRNRDLESVVKDIQQLIGEKIELPSGYTIDYGGQFENLRSARARLMIAVPVALLLIFILLHLAFGSMREALMVYTAIPLSAVGGVTLLWLRDLPFSISAGVGFIALFGIAVLNGIVLIEHFKELKKQGMTDLRALIIRGTSERLRPVLLTASAAALGFLPMAVSTSAGAEVQRPLATVVVGGLITATLLTMIVLPVLFCIFDTTGKKRKKTKLPALVPLTLLLLLAPLAVPAQKEISVGRAIDIAFENNALLKSARLQYDQQLKLNKAAFDPQKTTVYYNFDENNEAANGLPLKVWGIQQSFEYPGAYATRYQLSKLLAGQQQQLLMRTQKQLAAEVSKAYYELVYLQMTRRHYAQLDSLFARLAGSLQKSVNAGEIAPLSLLTAQARRLEASNALYDVDQQVKIAQGHLQSLLQSDTLFVPLQQEYQALIPLLSDSIWDGAHRYFALRQEIAGKNHQLSRRTALPDLQLEYFRGTNSGANAKAYNGYQIGIDIPLFLTAKHATNKAAAIQKDIVQEDNTQQMYALRDALQQLTETLSVHSRYLESYHNQGVVLADALLQAAGKSLESGEINFQQYLQTINEATQLKLGYLDRLHQYNMVVLKINYFTF